MKKMLYGLCVNFAPPSSSKYHMWDFFHIKNEMKLSWLEHIRAMGKPNQKCLVKADLDD